VSLYNPDTNKYIEKFVYINRIKPFYKRDHIPEDDEDIEDIPIVEVTYPEIFPRTPQTMSQPAVETPNEQHTLHAPPENNDTPIKSPPTTDSQIMEQASTVTETG